MPSIAISYKLVSHELFSCYLFFTNNYVLNILQEAKEKSQYLLQKAQEQMEEQEDEIKKLNEIILNARCHAIRDEQLVEKTEIKEEQLEEDQRYEDEGFVSNVSSNIQY